MRLEKTCFIARERETCFKPWFRNRTCFNTEQHVETCSYELRNCKNTCEHTIDDIYV